MSNKSYVVHHEADAYRAWFALLECPLSPLCFSGATNYGPDAWYMIPVVDFLAHKAFQLSCFLKYGVLLSHVDVQD